MVYMPYMSYHVYMSEEQVPIVEAREHIGRLVDAAHFSGDATVITKNGEPRAVLVPYDWYQEAEGRMLGGDRK